jgi:phosphoglucomutase
MSVTIVPTRAFADQRPGTAGLRKRVAVFKQPFYLENFVQAVFDAQPDLKGGSLVLGGDGRYWTREAIRAALRVFAANGVRKLWLAKGGLLTTPAAAMEIRTRGASGGFLLTASHNRGGPEGDFGIKFNVATGGQASEQLTERIFARSREIHRLKLLEDAPELEIDELGVHAYGPMEVEVFDPIPTYADAMARLFDFERIRAAIRGGLRVQFDALHAATGPFARAVLIDRLGLDPKALANGAPLPDFGGKHPDPNPKDCAHLVALAGRDDAPDLIAASDGDGDRNMILGRGVMVSPCDSLAVLAANAHLFPGYRGGLKGVARSMPTSRAVDRVAAKLGVPCYETPTGWRFFCNLLEADKVTLCGEESFGTSSAHAREKDGLWAVLAWLDLLAATGLSVREVLERHWAEFGRDYYLRQDWSIADAANAKAVMDGLKAALPTLTGREVEGLTVAKADSFAYTDPVDGSVSKDQGIRIEFAEGARAVFRVSGTDTAGATLRVYLEKHAPPGGDHQRLPVDALGQVAEAAKALSRVTAITGLNGPGAVI